MVKFFLKNNDDNLDGKARERYGVFASVVGILTNGALFLVKILIGLFTGSISIIADAFNNLSDGLASVITLVSFKLSERPADEEHPFGHGRTEYIASLVVAIFIGILGSEIFKSSVEKIFNPQDIEITLPILILMIFTVIAKIWQSKFYKKIGNKIDSKVLLAASKDSLSDVVVTSCTILSAGIMFFTSRNIDGIIGLLVSAFLFKSAYDVAADTLSTIIGESPSEELCTKIKDEVESYDGILGVHDLIVHSYGANKYIVTLHAEVSSENCIVESHEIVDRAEYEVGKKLGIHLTLHMDPVDSQNPRLNTIKYLVNSLIEKKYNGADCHDFRFVTAGKKTNVIFDLEIPHSYDTEMQYNAVKELKKTIKNIDENYECIINVEYSYTTH